MRLFVDWSKAIYIMPRAALWKGLSQLETITVNDFSLLKHCMNLSDLTINLEDIFCRDNILGIMLFEKNLADILDRNGHCLKRLTLTNFPYHYAQNFAINRLIANKLPNLTSLSINFLSYNLIVFVIDQYIH